VCLTHSSMTCLSVEDGVKTKVEAAAAAAAACAACAAAALEAEAPLPLVAPVGAAAVGGETAAA
jgi:hypothetical protein